MIGGLVVVLCFGNLAETLRRSAIPTRLDGTVSALEIRREKHPGLDDVHLLWMKGRAIHVDAQVAKVLRQGDRIVKPAWSNKLNTPRGQITLQVSEDFKGMMLMMPLIVLISAWLLRKQNP